MFSTDVILLDEPFSALDAITRESMHKWYLHLAEIYKKSSIFITHDIDEAILLSDKIYIMAESPGKIVSEIIIKEKKGEEFSVSNEFMSYKRKILEIMNI